MQLEELEVLRKQMQIMVQRIAELEHSNTRNLAIIQILIEKQEKPEDPSDGADTDRK